MVLQIHFLTGKEQEDFEPRVYLLAAYVITTKSRTI